MDVRIALVGIGTITANVIHVRLCVSAGHRIMVCYVGNVRLQQNVDVSAGHYILGCYVGYVRLQRIASVSAGH